MPLLESAYEDATRVGAWIERPRALRLIRLTGPQRIWFLQNTITADVEGATAGRWVESCFLDPKGRIQAQFRVGILDEEIWVDADPSAETLAEWFERYRFRTKVEIERHQLRCFAVVGPAASSWTKPGEVRNDRGHLAFGYLLGDVPVTDVHTDDTTVLAGDEAPSELYDVLRLEAGVGAFGVDYGERDLPQEAGLTRTVSVEKGCYVGQETVARIHFRGHVNRVLRQLTLEGVDAGKVAGKELRLEAVTVGRVTSAIASPKGSVVGLGMVRVEPPAGTILEVEGGGGAVLGPVPEGTKIKR